MARYNTVILSASASTTAAFTSPGSGSFTTFTGTAPYTVTIGDPVLFAGSTQTFYNSTSNSGVVTLSFTSTGSGKFVGLGIPGNATTQTTSAGSTISISSDGTNWVVTYYIGGPVTSTTLTANSTVTLSPANANVAISPTGSGTVTISPASSVTISPASTVTISPTSTLTINPTAVSTIDNVNIGTTTRGTGNFTSIGAGTAGSGLFTTLGASGLLSLTVSTGTHTISSSTASSTTGTGALTIAGGLGVAGQATVGTLSTGTITGSPTISSAATFTGSVTMQSMTEFIVDAALSSNTASFDYTTGNTFYLTSSPSGSMTFNFTNVPTTNGRSVTYTVFVPQGSTPYNPTTFNINGSGISVRWLYNTTPTPVASRIDIFTFTLVYRSSAFTLIGSLAPGC